MYLLLALAMLFIAAGLEIGGDVAIGRGMQSRSWLLGMGGAALLIAYGAIVNAYNLIVQRNSSEPWDFTRMLGLYIACFAVTNVVIDLVRRKPVSRAVLIGTAIIAIGGAVIQWGGRFHAN